MNALRLSNTAVGLSAAVVSLPAVCVATRRMMRGKQRLFAMEIGGGETGERECGGRQCGTGGFRERVSLLINDLHSSLGVINLTPANEHAC